MRLVQTRTRRGRKLVTAVASDWHEEYRALSDCSQAVWSILGEVYIEGVAGATMHEDTVELTFCVVPTWARGRGHQGRLLEARLAWGKRKGATKASTYTHHKNRFSQVNLLKAGFVVAYREGDFVTFTRDLT